MSYDAIVVGGSFAGLSAATQLARARRRVLVIDAGLPRNRFAAHAHGFYGHDGRAPAAIRADALAQLQAYPTAQVAHAIARSAAREGTDFVVTLEDGRVERATRLVLATGVRDELPPIAGLHERWGSTVLHCPYCHGYEVQGRPLGVLATVPGSLHQALLLPDWGPTTLFAQGVIVLDETTRAALQARAVQVETRQVVELLGDDDALEAVRLDDGRTLPMAAIFTAPKTHMSSPLAEQLGCAFDQGPTGPIIRVDTMQQTSVPGVFAAGDATSAMPNASFAAAAGVLAGVAAHRSMIAELASPH
jgi:thioredoxin reductase